MTNASDTHVIFGDLNSRVGSAAQQLICRNERFSYIPVDTIHHPSNHDGKLLSIAKDCELLIVNNLLYDGIHWKGGLTFRKKHNWISEVDLCFISRKSINFVYDFAVDQPLSFPSDHAPLSMSLDLNAIICSTRRSDLMTHASALVDHAVLHPATCAAPVDGRPPRRRALPFSRVDRALFLQDLQTTDKGNFLNILDPVDDSITKFTDLLYETAKKNIIPDTPPPLAAGNDRWQKIIKDKDDKSLWQATNWKGELKDTEKP